MVRHEMVDEAKVAATAQKLRVEPVPPGPYIPPRWDTAPSKPATPEPPVWKPNTIPGTVTNTGVILTDAEPSPLSRALEVHLARALSTPLPHDPDMHTRLMPWRGK